MTNTFVKLGNGMIINVNSIDGIFPNTNRAYNGGYTIQLNGKDFHLASSDAQSVFDAIGIYPDERPSRSIPFNPDKRIAAATHGYDFRSSSTKIKAVVDEFNKDRSYSKLEMKVVPDKKEIRLTSELDDDKVMVIQDGIITSDSLNNSSSYAELKTKINSILIEG